MQSASRSRLKQTLVLSLVAWILGSSVTHSQQPLLRSHESTRARNGVIIESSILADDKGKVFIEVPADMIVKSFQRETTDSNLYESDDNPAAYDGFILAPEVISLPEKFPISRYRPYVVFEFLSDSSEDVRFTDQYFGLKPKQLLQLESRQKSFVRKKMRAFFPVPKVDNVQKPSLYFFDPTRRNWKRLGGIYEETSDPDMQLFSVSISRTGLFALVDEDPPPMYTDEQNTDPSIIELAEESPFPSVIPEEEVDVEFITDSDSALESIDQLFESSPDVSDRDAITDIPSLQDNSDEVPALEPLTQEVLEETIPKQAEAPKPLEKKNVKDINYDPESTTSFLDLYNTGGSGRPVMIYIHGGAWVSGSRKNVSRSMIDYFDSQNMILASIDFRAIQRVPFEQQNVTFREQLSDIAKAVGWVYKNIGRYGGNPDNLHLLGFSSGAHNAALLTADTRYLNSQDVPQTAIQTVIAMDVPAYDIPRAIASAEDHGIGTMSESLTDLFGEDNITQIEASPVAYLNTHKPNPAYLLVYTDAFPVSTQDPNARQTLTEDQANHFAAKLEERGVPVIVSAGKKDQTHSSLLMDLGTKNDVVTGKVGNFYDVFLTTEVEETGDHPLETVSEDFEATAEDLNLLSSADDLDLSTNSFEGDIPPQAQLPKTGPLTYFYLLLSVLLVYVTHQRYKKLKTHWQE